MSHEVHECLPFGLALQPLLTAAPSDERREEGLGIRYPFFRTVSIKTTTGATQPAFCRDISADGVGLLHRATLEPGDVTITFTAEDGRQVNVQVRIVWSQPYDDGWNISGGQFLSVPGLGIL